MHTYETPSNQPVYPWFSKYILNLGLGNPMLINSADTSHLPLFSHWSIRFDVFFNTSRFLIKVGVNLTLGGGTFVVTKFQCDLQSTEYNLQQKITLCFCRRLRKCCSIMKSQNLR